MLTIDQVTFSYAQRQALRGVTLKLIPGQVLGLLGPNGAGKSTLLHIAAGMLSPSSGSATVDSQKPSQHHRVRAKIGFVPQQLALYRNLTVLENAMFYARLYGINKAQAHADATRWIRRVELHDRINRRVSTLSGGMKRRLNLVAGLIHNPDLVMLDEPTANIDPVSRQIVLAVVRELGEQRKSIVYCTHYMEEAQRLCDSFIILQNGSILAEGSLGQLITQTGAATTITYELDGSTYASQSNHPESDVKTLLNTALPKKLSVTPPDLESVYFALVDRAHAS